MQEALPTYRSGDQYVVAGTNRRAGRAGCLPAANSDPSRSRQMSSCEASRSAMRTVTLPFPSLAPRHHPVQRSAVALARLWETVVDQVAAAMLQMRPEPGLPMPWTPYFGLLIGGAAIGLTAIVLATLAVEAQRVFHLAFAFDPRLALLLTPLGFALVSYLTRRYVPGAGGSGIPQVVVALDAVEPELRSSMVSLKICVAEVLLLPVGLLFGASIGREGPTVQIGASIMYAFSRKVPQWSPALIAAGAGAEVAAAFNTPLAGIMFALEELTRRLDSRSTGLIMVTTLTAVVASLLVFGDYAYLGALPGGLAGWRDWLAVPLIGAICGLAGGLFCRTLVAVLGGLPGRVGRAIGRHPIGLSAACGFAVALCGLASGGAAFGTGYDQAFAMLHQSTAAAPLFAVWKFLATLISAISGIPGGIFAPSLAIGAGFGLDLAGLFPTTPAAVLGLLGMVGFLTGVVQ
eukprot:gene22269-23373_t